MDLRPNLPCTVAELRARLGGRVAYASLHRVLAGRQRPSVRLAQRIEVATGGLIRWTQFFGEPAVGLVVEPAIGDDPALVVATDEPSTPARKDTEPDLNCHGSLQGVA